VGGFAGSPLLAKAGYPQCPCSDTAIRAAKPRAAPYKLPDGGGLVLLVNPNGSRWWRLRYRFGGREKMLSVGVYPGTGLKQARELRDEARRLLTQGVDPGEQRKAEKATASGADTFEAIAREWWERSRCGWTEGHSKLVIRRLEENIFPWIGSRPVGEVSAPEILACLRRMEERGIGITTRKTRQYCSMIARYAIATGRAERDASADLRGALAAVTSGHRATITAPGEVGALLRAIDGYLGAFATCCALKLAPILFVRPGELRRAEWAEIDLDRAEWRIPAAPRSGCGHSPRAVPLHRHRQVPLSRCPHGGSPYERKHRQHGLAPLGL